MSAGPDNVIGVVWRLQYPATGAYLVELTLTKTATGESEIMALLDVGARLAKRLINRDGDKQTKGESDGHSQV